MNSSKSISILILLAGIAIFLLTQSSSCRAANLREANDETGLEIQSDDESDSSEPMTVDASEQSESEEDDVSSANDADDAKESASIQLPESSSDSEDAAESNIANAKIDLSSQDMSTAAGHHHHHGHYPHGWLKMGAHTGKKGSFGWHSKHPVGGKGRR